ncbi:thioredoxin domain-containing protein [Thiomonas sp.]
MSPHHERPASLRHSWFSGAVFGLALAAAPAAWAADPPASVAMEPGSLFQFLTPQLNTSQRQILAAFPGYTVGPENGRRVYILFRPDCSHCHALWRQLQVLRNTNPEVAALQFRWIPVLVTVADAQRLRPYWHTPRNARSLAGLMSGAPAAETVDAPPSMLQLEQRMAPALGWLRQTGAQDVPAVVAPLPRRTVRLRLGDPVDSVLLAWLGVS